MKKLLKYLAVLILPLSSCTKDVKIPAFNGSPEELSLPVVARILSELPMDASNYSEVHDAVSSSSGNGYDEEYLMSSLIESPGAGVGESHPYTRATAYSRPLKDLLAEYFSQHPSTRSAEAGVQACLDALGSSDMQIYWPYSENWDGKTPPVISFDPESEEDTNYGYEISASGSPSLVEVSEDMAKERPVWIVNRNDDSEFLPVDFFEPSSLEQQSAGKNKGQLLYVKSIKMLRHYDSWFGGASEFFIRCGAVDGFWAETDEDLRTYSPEITDFMVVVKRNQLGKTVPFNAILLSDYTEQMDKIAFLVTEDDGGTRTSWKCEAVVKYNSRSYGFTMDIPYNEKDDIVWRGQLSRNFFGDKDSVVGRFGDLVITFGLL